MENARTNKLMLEPLRECNIHILKSQTRSNKSRLYYKPDKPLDKNLIHKTLVYKIFSDILVITRTRKVF